LNAYFLDPDAYETEYVESRIRGISGELAEDEFTQRVKAGAEVTGMLDDPNPVIVSLPLTQMDDHWKPSYLESVLKCLGNDDGDTRWQATELLKNHADRTFDEKLNALLKDGDLRKRGLAAYLAVDRWKTRSFAIIKSMLLEESQLLRFDAVSALMLEGGREGRKIALEHAAREQNATLKKLIESPKLNDTEP
jgi:hypothetical protein